ncbi:MAG: PD-(D/E)XK nuclease-like domain-containing protein, partial [Oscillospiraceae bacterium]|nr:PD-(D/E)XK nuclease-like domain-containing protein [Oscillospiraceae bacterium]
LQAACYQEIVYQNTGKRLPFIFVVVTKENPPHLAVGEINQWNMDEALETVKARIREYQKIKNSELPPERCEDYNCKYCTETKILTEPIDTDLFGMSTAQIKAMKGEL